MFNRESVLQAVEVEFERWDTLMFEYRQRVSRYC